MKLVEVKDYIVSPTQEMFYCKCFRELWEEDTSPNKEIFFSQLSYIYYMYDPRTTYDEFEDLEERSQKIREQEGFPKYVHLKSKLMDRCIEVYKQKTMTTSAALLQDTKVAVNNLRRLLREMDPSETDDKGKPKYPINQVVSAIEKVPQLARTLVEAERIVNKEIEEQGRVRGGQDKTIGEDG